MNTTTNEMLSNVNTDNLLRETLAHFNTGYIIDLIRNTINMKFRPYSTAMPGLNSIEMNFQSMLQNFTDADYQSQIFEVRRCTYDNIIAIICQYYNLTYYPDDDIDNYTVAYFLYNTLVSNFTATIVSFFINYIMQHQDQIYDQIHVEEATKRDELNTYSRKLYGSSSKIGIIHSKIDQAIDFVASLDIEFNDILQYGDCTPECIAILSNSISENDNTFRIRFLPYLISPTTRADLITLIKLKLQIYAASDLYNISFIKEEN